MPVQNLCQAPPKSAPDSTDDQVNVVKCPIGEQKQGIIDCNTLKVFSYFHATATCPAN